MRPQDSVVIKSLDVISFPEWQKQENRERDDTLSMRDVCDNFQNEIVAYQRIWKHNKSCPPKKQINVPKFLFSGDLYHSADVSVTGVDGILRLVSGPYLVLEKLEGVRHPDLESAKEFKKVIRELLRNWMLLG
ncbi:unnamed protein product [Ambrosiozyma monospora]|uniref:Unnamed protein product n=1 Tax=Ambrosiozyma monospora TaxID=43982 RepID=A0ACB5U493_AMBMO|nr:unnamed protein product [Ambrosiozyma monospora]